VRIDAIVAGGCAASYVGTAIWAPSALAAPFGSIVTVKDLLIASLCAAWMIAELRAGARRARGVALAAAIVILADAVLALVGGAGPWRTDIAPDGSLVGSLVVGVGLVVAGVALVWFVRRPA
jgi:hypothetical protein